MSEIVCNSCGAPDKTNTCPHCPVTICDRCKLNHEMVCKDNVARVKRGEGPTVRVRPTPNRPEIFAASPVVISRLEVTAEELDNFRGVVVPTPEAETEITTTEDEPQGPSEED